MRMWGNRVQLLTPVSSQSSDASEGQQLRKLPHRLRLLRYWKAEFLPAANAHQVPPFLPRERQGKQAARGQRVHGEILVLLASLGHQERGRMGSR